MGVDGMNMGIGTRVWMVWICVLMGVDGMNMGVYGGMDMGVDGIDMDVVDMGVGDMNMHHHRHHNNNNNNKQQQK